MYSPSPVHLSSVIDTHHWASQQWLQPTSPNPCIPASCNIFWVFFTQQGKPMPFIILAVISNTYIPLSCDGASKQCLQSTSATPVSLLLVISFVSLFQTSFEAKPVWNCDRPTDQCSEWLYGVEFGATSIAKTITLKNFDFPLYFGPNWCPISHCSPSLCRCNVSQP